jgi:hypothetical protein
MNNEPTKEYGHLVQLLAAANFLAAFGGGSILGMADDAFKTPRHTVETFLLGTTLGLGLLFLLRSKLFRGAHLTGAWFSFAGGTVSLITAAILWQHLADSQHDDNAAWAIYLLLSLRFGLWFVARVQRPDIVAGRRRKIGWIELCYYLGVISGIVFAGTLQDRLNLIQLVLFLDCLSQWVAGFFDLLARRRAPAATVADAAEAVEPLPYNLSWYTRAVLAVVTLTVGTQAVTFGFMGLIKGSSVALPGVGPTDPSHFILATFYLGVAGASVFYGLKKIRLEWPFATKRLARFATIFVGEDGERKKSVAFHWLSAIGAAFLAVAIIGNQLSMQAAAFGPDARLTLSVVKLLFFLLFIAAAAFIYEVLALTLFDHIGEETKRLNRGGMVALAYGFMGLGVTVTLLVVDDFVAPGPRELARLSAAEVIQLKVQAHRYLLYILTGCLVIANLAMAFSADAKRLRSRLGRRPSRRSEAGD